jgi:hypothetical protein
MEMSTEVSKLFDALCKAQGSVSHAIKDSDNTQYKSQYASLAAVVSAIKAPLSSNGLMLTQWPESDGDDVYLTTILGHVSGQWIKSRIKMLLVKKDPQGLGSAMTYYRRYSACSIVGLHQDDDDGQDHRKGLERQEKMEEERLNLEKENLEIERRKLKLAETQAKQVQQVQTAQTAQIAIDVTKTISAQQLAELMQLVKPNTDTYSKILDHYKIPSLDQLPVDQFNPVISRLKSKVAV